MPSKNDLYQGSLWQLTLTELGHLKSEFVWAHDHHVLVNQFKTMRYQAPGQTAYLVLKGELNVETDAGRVTVGPGHWCVPHHGPRLLRMDTPGQHLSVRFRLYWPGGEPLFNAPIATVFTAEEGLLLEKKTRVLIRTVAKAIPGVAADLPWRKADLMTHFVFQRTFGAWLHAYVETMLRLGVVPSRLAKKDPRVLDLIKKLDEFPLTQTIDEKSLFAGSGLSSSQMNRLFIQYFSCTPHQYLERRKFTHARMLIRSSSLAIKEIAYEVGFGSLSAFSRWFKQKSRQSPREFKHKEQV
ncbi:MAG: AraC family transcriptional regulator [Opitutaceae bacterium]|jgi:AraC-like DNA-binding protein